MEGLTILEFMDLVNDLHHEAEYADLPVIVGGRPLEEMFVNLATVVDPETNEPHVALVIE